jgi:CubicO group peptidase (beta-lactamase class C family)
MKKLQKLLFIVVFLSVYMMSMNNVLVKAQPIQIEQQQVERVVNFVEDRMKKAKIPGAAIVIVQGDKLLYKGGFGFRNLEAEQVVDTDTYFELGSTTKAFTALAVLKLEQEGKVQSRDSVTMYIPEFNMYFNGAKADITLEQLLNHTSGIAFKSIDKIPVSTENDALEKTVQMLVGQELQSAPGTEFSYATINYDILGLIIQRVTGQSYEAYMTNHILRPLEMNSTYLFESDVPQNKASKGYKMFFLKPRSYDAPIYRGNTPAGYILTNAEEMEKWLKFQLGFLAEGQIDNTLILKSHQFDPSHVSAGEDWMYRDGWYIDDNGGRVFHGGNNPNFSSAIFLQPGEGLGVALLTNMNSDYTYSTAKDMLKILNGQNVNSVTSDIYSVIDMISMIVFIIMLVVIIAMLIAKWRFILQIFNGQRGYVTPKFITTIKIVIYLLLLIVIEWGIYHIPQFAFNGVGWGFVSVWAPFSTLMAAAELGGGIGLYFLYRIAGLFFRSGHSVSNQVKTIKAGGGKWGM